MVGSHGSEDGRVGLSEAQDESDPVTDLILECLARDLERVPSPVIAFPACLAGRMKALAAGMDVDLDEEIDGAVML